jgi:hypothetical protein
MVIVSPSAKPGFTDSTTATFSGMLPYVEHTFGVSPLTADDPNAYDFQNSFDCSQPPLPGSRLHTTRVPRLERRVIAAHPGNTDDPT